MGLITQLPAAAARESAGNQYTPQSMSLAGQWAFFAILSTLLLLITPLNFMPIGKVGSVKPIEGNGAG